MDVINAKMPVIRFGVRLDALWQKVLRASRHSKKRLRLCESVALGERRFVAVVEFDAARFLIGGTPSSLVLLSRLADAGEAEEWQAPSAIAKRPPSAGPRVQGQEC